MQRKRAMLSDIAEKARVSLSTASRAVRNQAGVSRAVRGRVLRAAEQLNYVPNQLARALAQGRTNVIGLVTPPIMQITSEGATAGRVEALARAAGMGVVHFRYGPAESQLVREIAVKHQWDGVLIFPNAPADVTGALAEALTADGIPTIVIGPAHWRINVDYVSFDREYGVRLLLDHALAQGLRRVALLAAAREVRNLERSVKYDSLEADLRARGMDLAASIPVNLEAQRGPALYRASRDAVADALAGGLQADLLMAANDTVAAGALNALQDRGVRVPEDMAVSGYDDEEWGEYARPALTTVRIPCLEMVDVAWDLLQRRLDHGVGDPQGIVLRPSLVIRKSTSRKGDPAS